MVSKKERNHYDLKEIENYRITKTIPKRLAGKGGKQILDKLQSNFPLKMDCYNTKRSELSLQIRIVKSTSSYRHIIYDIHKGSDDTSHSKAILAYRLIIQT